MDLELREAIEQQEELLQCFFLRCHAQRPRWPLGGFVPMLLGHQSDQFMVPQGPADLGLCLYLFVGLKAGSCPVFHCC